MNGSGSGQFDSAHHGPVELVGLLDGASRVFKYTRRIIKDWPILSKMTQVLVEGRGTPEHVGHLMKRVGRNQNSESSVSSSWTKHRCTHIHNVGSIK